MSKYIFDITKFGFIRLEENYFAFIKDHKIFYTATYLDGIQGVESEWVIKEVVHGANNHVKTNPIFSGRIPSDIFGSELIGNLLY